MSRMHFKIRHAYTPSIQGERAFQLLPPTSGLSKHHPLRQPSTQNAGRSNMLNSRASTGQSWRRRSFGLFPQLFCSRHSRCVSNQKACAAECHFPGTTCRTSAEHRDQIDRHCHMDDAPPARPPSPPAHTHEHARTSTHELNPFPAMVPTLAHSLSLNRH